LYNGPAGSAGELGHMTVDINGPKCVCGNIGCLETLVSGPVMARQAKERINQGEHSSLVEMVDKIEDITAEDISIAARAGDSLSLDIVTKTGTYLGIGLVNVVNIFNPEMIILAGGVAELGDLLLDPARCLVKERAFPISTQVVRIVIAELGDEAAVRGAAVFALEQAS
jgi:predicted NBD/HSP70 family sugar kinase